MRALIVPLLVVVAALVPSDSAAQSLDPTRLIGRWSGSGSFFGADMQRKAGSLAFLLDLRADGTGTGRIGEATLQITGVRPARDRIEVRAKLTGAPGPDPSLAKNHLVLVVTAVDSSRVQAEFHLKSNSIFDPQMREGHVVLTRLPR